MTALVGLYEDGVALSTLAAAASWDYPRANGVLHRARQAGVGTGARRYIPKVSEQTQDGKVYRYRDLTTSEHAALTAAWQNLPASGASKSWKNPDGRRLLALMESVLAGGVSLAKIAALLTKHAPGGGTISRQGLHQQLVAHRAS